jgi:pimeloyl-ACP methyl ester carboxylesterase
LTALDPDQAARLRRYATLLRHEAAGTTDDAEYASVVADLYSRHLRRCHTWDPQRSRAEYDASIAPLLADLGPAYAEMWGHNEFLATGNLITWDVTDRLGEIDVPALIVCGLHDELGVPSTRRWPIACPTTSS